MPLGKYAGWPPDDGSTFDRPSRSIPDLVRRVAERQPDAIAIVDGELRTTYRELVDRAAQLADRIARITEPGEPVALLLPNNAAYPVALVACLAAGRPAIVLDSEYPEERNRLILLHSGAKTLVRPDQAESNGIAAIRLSAEVGVSAATAAVAAAFDPDSPAVVVYTSGSTGQPKGISLSQRALLHRAGQLIETLQFGPTDKSMPLGSPCTIAGLLQTFEALLAGATLVKCDVRKKGIGAVLETIARERVTALFSTPALLRILCRIDEARDRFQSLRCVHPSGDVLLSADVDLLRKVIPERCLILTAYGLSEAPGICHWFVPRDGFGAGRVAVGSPVGGYACAILDDEGRPVQSGEAGELVVRSRFTALGEWHDGAIVPGALWPDPTDPALRVLHTGDLVKQGPDGVITVLGRKDRQVQIHGMRVEPYEIECALRAEPSILDAAVVVHETGGDKALTAFVVLAGVADTEALGRIKRHIQQSLPSHMRPSRILPLDALPLLPGYKIDVDALRAHAERAPGAGLPAGLSTQSGDIAESAVEEAWASVLGPMIAPGMTFGEAGGDSLNLLTLVFRLESELGLSLPLADFDHVMTAADMTRIVRAALADGTQSERSALGPSAVLLKSGTAQPPVFIACALGGHAGEIAALGRLMKTDRPVVGLQPAALNGGALPANITGFAAEYAATIRKIQPRGPYLLAGYSVGGLIMLEAARLLQDAGDEVALLSLLDTYPHRRFWPLRTWLDRLARRGLHHLRTIVRLPLAEIPAYAADRVRSLIGQIAARIGSTPEPLPKQWEAGTAALRNVRRGLVTAEAGYRPRRYPGRIAFLTAETRRWEFPRDPLWVWRELSEEIDLIPVRGDHTTMVGLHAPALAAALDRCVDQALGAN